MKNEYNEANVQLSRYNNGDYLKKNLDWHVSDSAWKADQIDKIINQNNLKFSSICEVGCGAGEILRQLSLKKKNYSVKFSGYEISDDAFNLCKKRESENLNFFKEDLVKINKKFDALLCIDVFEHVQNYMEFISSIKNKAEYKIFHIPLDLSVSSLIRGTLMYNRETIGHLHYFNSDTAIATLKDCNYEIIDKMFTPSFISSSRKSLKTLLAKIPRHILYAFSPKLMSTLIGGASLMVLTR